MSGLAGHFASLGRYVAQHDRRRVADETAAGELSARAPEALALPRGLELEWLGVAGYRLTYEGQTLYVDPYVSRVPLRSLLRGRTPALADLELHEHWLRPHGRVLGVLVGHTHFDHAIDVPAICAREGCSAYGSSSLVQLMRVYGQAGQAVQVTPHQPFQLGPFRVTFVPSVHSKLLLGYAVP